MDWSLTAAMRARAASSAAAVALGLLAGCEREEPTGPPTPTVVASEPVSSPAQFWLRRATISTDLSGKRWLDIEEPTRVQVLADGSVRNVASGVEEQVASDLVKHPQDGVGLMLYAHRTADLHLGFPDGPVVARLHPGAFVSVAPTTEARWEIAVPGYGFHGFVESSALSPEPVPESAPTLRGTVYRDHGLHLLYPEDRQGRWFTRLQCGEFILEDSLARQFRRGVEVFGHIVEKPAAPAGHFDCVAPRIYSRENTLFMDGGRWRDAVALDSIPEGFVEYSPPSPDPLLAIMRRRGSIHWLVWTPEGLMCHEWRFGALAPATTLAPTGALETRIDWAGAPPGIFMRLMYEPAGRRAVGHLRLWPFGGLAVDTYALVLAEEDTLYFDAELDLDEAGRSAPDVAWLRKEKARDAAKLARLPVHRAVLKSGLKRWFTTARSCEAARVQMAAILASDPNAVESRGVQNNWYEYVKGPESR